MHPGSHIIPEWMYEKVYDAKGKAHAFSLNKLEVEKVQKGLRGEFWCWACETRSAVWDTYACKALTEKTPTAPERMKLVRKPGREKIGAAILDYEQWTGLDFGLFSRFILSVVLRGDLSDRARGKNSLTDEHFERIRAICFDNKSPNDADYPMILVKFPDNDPAKDHVILPCSGDFGDHLVVSFTGAGYLFTVIVASRDYSRAGLEVRLKQNGSVLVMRQRFDKTALHHNLLPGLGQIDKKYEGDPFKRKKKIRKSR